MGLGISLTSRQVIRMPDGKATESAVNDSDAETCVLLGFPSLTGIALRHLLYRGEANRASESMYQ